MLSYRDTMLIGQASYQDVLDSLTAAGFGATLTQTGGMNAALEVLLDGGHTLLITDAEGSLSWDREEHQGWGVGLYPPDQANTDGDCLAFESTDDRSTAALLPLVNAVLTGYVRKRRTEASRTGST